MKPMPVGSTRSRVPVINDWIAVLWKAELTDGRHLRLGGTVALETGSRPVDTFDVCKVWTVTRGIASAVGRRKLFISQAPPSTGWFAAQRVG